MNSLQKSAIQTAVFCCALAPSATAQTPFSFLPFERTGDLFVVDTSSDSIFRLVDLDLNGDYNGLGETVEFYSDSVGSMSLGNNSGVTVMLGGQLLVSDSSEDKIFRLLDIDGDGNCYAPGEITVFFDGDPAVNASGIEMVSASDLTAEAFGRVFVASANTGSGGVDAIISLFDANGDGDANDVGEASLYYQPTTLGATGDSIPNDVVVGLDGNLYYVEGGSTGVVPKAVFKLVDANNDNVIDPLTEVTTFFVPPAGAGNPFFWSLTQDHAGYFYTADSGNDVIWRFRDENSDGVIDPVTEAVMWWQAAGSSLIWDLSAASDGSLYAAESQSPDRIVRLFDTDGNGTIDPVLEVSEVYSESVSAADIKNPRGLIFEQGPRLQVPAMAAVGSPMSVTVGGTSGDVFAVWYSSATSAPVAYAPFGFVELSVTAGDAFGELYTGLISTAGLHQQSFTVPNDPALAGLQVHLQGIVGKPDRLQLTNLASLALF